MKYLSAFLMIIGYYTGYDCYECIKCYSLKMHLSDMFLTLFYNRSIRPKTKDNNTRSVMLNSS